MVREFIVEQGDDIQAIIEECKEQGGGKVVVEAGEYKIASIRLYSDMTLYLKGDARLIASENWKDYTNYNVPTTLGYVHSPRIHKKWNVPEDHYVNAIITAVEAENVSVIGEPGSLIDGMNCFDPNGEEKFRGPMGMVFCKCKNVTLSGYTIQNTANWAHQIDSSINIDFNNITVLAGHDGVNVHHCKNVWIHDCTFKTGDDCVAGYDATNVTVEDCYMNTSCNAFRIGAVNLKVKNIQMEGDGIYPHIVSGRHNMLYAFDYYSLEDDVISENSKNWIIEDCTLKNMKGLIYYSFGDDDENQTNRPMEDVTFVNCHCEDLALASTFKTKPDCPATLTLKSCTFRKNNVPVDFDCNLSSNTKLLFL